MSVENVNAFFEKAMSDEAARAALKSLGEKSKGNQDEAVADLIALGKEHGFEFEHGHLADAVQARPGELSEDELQKVAGGGQSKCNPIYLVVCWGGDAFSCADSYSAID